MASRLSLSAPFLNISLLEIIFLDLLFINIGWGLLNLIPLYPLDGGQSLEALMELLRVPSISTDPAYKADCARAADWLAADLRTLGFDAAAHPTPGHPMVVGHGGPERAGGRHLLFYGHYDVQPVDPVSLWKRDPFDPALEETAKGTVIRGRGSSRSSVAVSASA